ncbi:MAG: helix-turn-helix transcriptional regulator [Clostridia bacterium]|nr:helix-turn-helix transcriptional regulator [Clostridia bacterium]
MEFNKKLQELRKQRGLTQEELGEKLFVSRTAISKWELGRGYPNIDSLKCIAKFFDISVDDLLSSKELLSVAEEDNKQKRSCFINMVFGLIDLSFILLFCLPLFAQKIDGVIYEVSLLNLKQIKLYLRIVFLGLVSLHVVLGIITLALKESKYKFWHRYNRIISLILTSVVVTLFTVCLQPYASIFSFVFLIIKAMMLLKK